MNNIPTPSLRELIDKGIVAPLVFGANNTSLDLDMSVKIDKEVPIIKPCPFCGSHNVEIEETSKGCRVVCYHCGIGHVENNWTRDYVINTWNSRLL